MRKIMFAETGKLVKRRDQGSTELWQVKGVVNIRQIKKNNLRKTCKIL